MHLSIRRPLVAVLSVLSVVAVVGLGGAGWARRSPDYQRRLLTIPMRDGVKLFAVALVPTRPRRPLPILLMRTPFGAADAIEGTDLPPRYRELMQDGYLLVVEDIRGRFRSDGVWVNTRANDDPRNPPGVNESTDAYDTIEWLVHHLPGNNGRVGVLGSSYPGLLAALAAVEPHPAVKAISPQAPVADSWLGDDFFHQGAFRQTMGVIFSSLMEVDPKGFHVTDPPSHDDYAWYLGFPTLDSLARAAGVAALPSWREYVAHPTYDPFWQAKALQRVLATATVPTLFVGGFWDQEDMLGPQVTYRAVERHDDQNRNRLVLGPWWHNQWLMPGGDSIGPVALGSSTADWFRAEVERPWFAWYLHGRGHGRFPEAWAFETGAGAGRWRMFDRWPPKQAEIRRLYFREGGGLSFDPPADAASAAPSASDAYVSDPAHPVPYLPGPDDGAGWRTWLLQDQRFVDGRPDVLAFTSTPLAEDVTIAGGVTARLFASTSGTDADWVVKLIDVYPDRTPEQPAMAGYRLMVSADIVRGRYWRSFDRVTPIPANTVTPFTVDLHDQLYRFRRGHRIMVQLQSSWFPLYDRNPQTFVPSIFHASASDYQRQEHRVWHTARWPSHVEVGVLPAGR